MIEGKQVKVETVYVVGGDYLIAKMFAGRGYKMVDTAKEADTLVFTGGADVPPEMYGEKNVVSQCNPAREMREKSIVSKWVGRKNMIGICRGSQFLNVVNGGKLWQHVDNHGIHGTHGVLDLKTEKIHQCTSTHHQMIRPAEDGIVVAVSAELVGQGCSTLRINEEGSRERETGEEDIEVVWYPYTDSLCFQGHPEYGVKECENYFFELVEGLYK